MRRGCLFRTLIAAAVLLLICCVTAFLGRPFLLDRFSDAGGDAVSTEIARRVPLTAREGEVRLPFDSIDNSLKGTSDDVNLHISADGNDIVVRFDYSNRVGAYRFTPRVESDGHIAFSTASDDSSWVTRIFPPSTFSDMVSKGVNQYLDAHNLRLTDVHVEDNELVLSFVEK